jgi:hypothetical protein
MGEGPFQIVQSLLVLYEGMQGASLFILSGFVSMLIKAPPPGHDPFSKAVVSPVGLYAPAGTKTVMTVFLFFLKASAFVFGSVW